MPRLTASHTRTLLSVFLLLGNAKVNAGEIKVGEKIQETHTEESQKLKEKPLSENCILASELQGIDFGVKNHSFPVVERDGVRWYDLGSVQDTRLDITENCHSVRGITASSGGCKVRVLRLDYAYLLDQDLLDNCPLKNVTLEGKSWRCAEEGRMLQRRPGLMLDMDRAKCGDMWRGKEEKVVAVPYKMDEGIRKLDQLGITRCSAERCACKWYYISSASYTVNVDCDNVGLTDDLLPALPSQVEILSLKGNALRSMDRLVTHLLPHHHTIKMLVLDDNKMEALPRLPKESFPRLLDLHLQRNNLKKIDIEAFKDLITRKELIVNLNGNQFTCDCLLYRFKVFLQEEYMRHWSSLKSYMNMTCKYNDEDVKSLKLLREDLCTTGLQWRNEYWWWVLNVTLALLNIAALCLMLDLAHILVYKKERQPVMDRVVCAFKSVRYWFKTPRKRAND